MFVLKFITSVFSAIALLVTSLGTILGGTSVVSVRINTLKLGDEIPNIVDNVNIWDMGTQFYDAENNDENDIFRFVKYVQLMQCTGGTAERDLFVNPYDTSTYTDYDFTRLIKNCQGILNLGAKPVLKLGGVPLKFTSNYEIGGFGMNVFPPDDFNLYYDYIKAIATELVNRFGLEEVKTWRFGCMTEYENADWFMAKSKTPEDSAVAFCKLYDYTVQALIDVIGDDVFVGAHGMCVTEGLWDENIFIKHVATGTNYANGQKGTHIDYLSASFYDRKPEKYTEGKAVPELIKDLKKSAEKYGLNDLIYGVDEGRILNGNSSGKSDSQLLSRVTGFTWQAAYDARVFKQAIDYGMDYFSSWDFLSGGLLNGYPIISYHVANNIADFAGSRQAEVELKSIKPMKVEADCLTGWNEDTETLHIMAYNYKNDVEYNKKMKLKFNISVPQLNGKKVTVVKYIINDDCNFFDEWQADRKKYNITDDCFSWSPDDPVIDSKTTLSDEDAINTYKTLLRDKYINCSELTPVTQMVTVKDGKLKFEETIDGSNVLFYEIY